MAVMENRMERVVLETARYRITGDLTLPREGYRSRISDFLNRGDLDFIPLVNVEIEPLRGDAPGSTERRDFVAVARGQIDFAYLLDE
jgi:hypothetical protein